MVKEPYSLSFKNIPLDASILSCHIVAERNAGMGQVGKIKRLISHKLVAGKRIPGSQFAVQRFHHLEIVISQILDGKNTAGLPGQSNQIIYDKSISNQLALDKESAGSNSILTLYERIPAGISHHAGEQFQIEPARLAGTCHISPQTLQRAHRNRFLGITLYLSGKEIKIPW